MSRFIFAAVCSVGVVAFGGAALAGGTPPSSGPAAQLSELDYFNGTWNCSGEAMDKSGTAHPSSGTLTVARAFGNQWVALEWAGTSDPNASGVVYQGFDPKLNKFVQLGVSSHGGYGGGLSEGWDKGTFVWVGEISSPGHAFHFRETITKVSDTSFSRKYETGDGLSLFKVVGLATCTQAASNQGNTGSN